MKSINARRLYAFGCGSVAAGAGREIINRVEPHWIGWVVALLLLATAAAISCVGEER